VTATGRRVVILRVFAKKNQKTPRREIELARQRAKEVTWARIPVEESFAEWRKDPKHVKAYNALEDEFSLARAMIEARAHAGLTQEQLAERMDTTQAVIARLESGRVKPSTRTLERLAAATGMRLRISFEPAPARWRMSLTRSFNALVQRRVASDAAFGEAILRDYIKATMGFEKLGEATDTPPKSLIRMFGPRGNPQAKNLFSVLGYLQRQAGLQLHVTTGLV
jgi:transcriptional regulator with XRE-family HTH domain